MSQQEAPPPAVAHRILLAADRAALGTTMRGGQSAAPPGSPYVSLVLLAFAEDTAPLLLLSDLAEHSRNLAADPRASLLIDATAGFADPLTGPRLTLMGSVATVPDLALRGRFVARHPSAALYAGFADFKLYRMQVFGAHLVQGFGRIYWIDPSALRS